MTNIKFKRINREEDMMKLFLAYAERLGLYDSRFSEKDQCGGYRTFKDLCFNDDTFSRIYDTADPRFSGLHVSLVRAALDLALQFKTRFNKIKNETNNNNRKSGDLLLTSGNTGSMVQ
jgi:hypothetical protein